MLLKLTRFICAVIAIIGFTFMFLPVSFFIGYLVKDPYNITTKEISSDFYSLTLKWLLFKDE